MSRPGSSRSTFLGEEAADMLAWWASRQLDEVSRSLHPAWSAWTRDWLGGSAPAAGDVVCTLAHEKPDGAAARWLPVGARGRSIGWIEADDPVTDIREALFGTSSGAPAPLAKESIAQAVASRAWGALLNGLCGCLALDAADGRPAPGPKLFRPWSGCVAVSLTGAGISPRSLLLNAQCVRLLLGERVRHPQAEHTENRRVAVTAVEEALRQRKLPIRVELAGCELDLGSLESLRVGDIVPLPHRLDTPLLISTSADTLLCGGFLGRHSGSRAIELMRESSATKANCSSTTTP